MRVKHNAIPPENVNLLITLKSNKDLLSKLIKELARTAKLEKQKRILNLRLVQERRKRRKK